LELRYDITVTGEQNIRRAFRGVEAEVAASSKRASAKADKMPGGASARRVTERETLAAQKKIEREAVAAQRRIAKDEAAATKKSERDRLASEKRVWQEKADNARRLAQIEVQENQKAQQKIAASAKASKAQWAKTSQGVARGVGTSVANTGRSIAMVGGTILGAVGAMGAGEAVSQEIGLDQRVRQVTVNARQSGETAADPKALRSHVRDTALATGATESGLIGAVETYTARTGDIKTATANLRTFATVAMATGASVEDVASTAADLAQKFNITKPKEMADAFAVLAFQGKKGAFELRDMASTFPEMAAAAQRMGMKGVGGMKTLGGLAQLARTSTGSGAEASTAVQMMLTQLTMEAGNLKSGKALGGKSVNVFEGGDATKGARDIREVLADVISGSHGNMTQLAGLFDARGVRAASPLITAYRSASDAAGGGNKGEAAGRAAVLKTISEASDAAAYFTEVEKDAADVAKSDAVKLEKINTRLREAFSSSLLPAIERMMPAFEEMIPKIAAVTESLAGVASWAVSNPLSGIGAALTAAVVKDVGSAALGTAISKALATQAGQGAGIVIGTAAITAGVMNLFQASAEIDANRRSSAMEKNSQEIRAQAAQEMGETGRLSPETRSRLEKLRERDTKRLSDEGDPLAGVGTVRAVANTFSGGLLGPTMFDDRHVQKQVDRDRYPEIIKSKSEANSFLLMDDAAKQVGISAQKVGAAADKLNAAGDKLAANDPARKGPIVSRN
jgi:hypothetical protein